MITIKEIAQKAQVSIGTVDRVLHNRGRVARTTKEKVQEIIDQFGYQPNLYASQLKLAKQFIFGVLVPYPEQDNGYWQMPYKGIQKAEKELKKQKIKIKYSFYDKYNVTSLTQSFQKISQPQIDGLLIAPTLLEATKHILNRISNNIPYLFFDSYVPGLNQLSFIGQDSYRSGLLAGKLLKMIVPAMGKILVVKFLPEDYHISERIKGFVEFFKNEYNYQINICEIDGGLAGKEFTQKAIEVFNKYQNVQGIFITNSLAHRIIDFLEKNVKNEKIKIIGYDLVEKNIRDLQQGKIDFLLSQSPEYQGYQGLYALYRHLVLKEEIEKEIMVPIDIITKENIDYYRK